MQTEMQHHATHEEVPYHGTLQGYATGFFLALVLTAVPFALVMKGLLTESGLLIGVTLAAIVQVIVHLHFFLHLDRSASERWNVMSLLFTIFIMAIFVAGSIWIIYSLHVRMTDHGMSHQHMHTSVEMHSN